MDFHKQYRGMNENITPSDALVQQTIAKMESGRPHRARKPLKIILAVAAALACVSTAVAANQEAVLRVLYQIAPGMAEYLQPVGQVCEDQGVKLEVVSADVEGSTAKVYLSLTDTTGSLFGDAAPDLYDSWHLDYPRWGRAAPLSCGCSTVDYDPSTHTATYFLQIDDLGGDIPAGAFEFSFNKLLIGKVEQEGIPVTADLSAVPKNAPTENHEINGPECLGYFDVRRRTRLRFSCSAGHALAKRGRQFYAHCGSVARWCTAPVIPHGRQAVARQPCGFCGTPHDGRH